MHGTFYVQRPLPKNIRDGHTLTGEDAAEIRNLLRRRDDWLQWYQKMELTKNREIANLRRALTDVTNYVRVPLTGYALQNGTAQGVFIDGWVSSHAELEIQPQTPVSGILLHGWRPVWYGFHMGSGLFGRCLFLFPCRFLRLRGQRLVSAHHRAPTKSSRCSLVRQRPRRFAAAMFSRVSARCLRFKAFHF